MWRVSHRAMMLILVGGLLLGEVPILYQPNAISAPVEASVSRPFEVLDGTLYRSKPDLSSLGFKPLKIIYVSEFGKDWSSGPTKMQLPPEDVVKQVARTAAATESLVVIDIEHWPLAGSPSLVQESLDKYRRIATWFHEAASTMEIGFFGIVPRAAYGWSLKGADSWEYQSWQQVNEALAPLAEKVDVMFPYAYTYYPDQAEWVRFATENIKEARRYGKPVYVFLWPQYVDNAGKLAGKPVPEDYWKLQLETVRKLADGMVIWGGWGPNGPEPWNEDAPWWKVTKRFLERHPPQAPNSLKVR